MVCLNEAQYTNEPYSTLFYVFSYIGIPDRAVCQPEKIEIPVQLHFGELDNMMGFSGMCLSNSIIQCTTEEDREKEN